MIDNFSDAPPDYDSVIGSTLLEGITDNIIYDDSEDHHDGFRNYVYLFDDENPDSQSSIIVTPEINVETVGTLDVNPNNSDNILFTLTTSDGDTVEIRTTDAENTIGTAQTITIKVKSQNRTIQIDDQAVELDTDSTYDIYVPNEEGNFFSYLLTESGGQGNWKMEFFQIENRGNIQVRKNN